MKKIYLILFGVALCFLLNAQVAVTFSVDMNDVDATTDSLHVAGNFNDPDGPGSTYPAGYNAAYVDWTPSAILMTDIDLDGIFTVVLNLNPARYEFKFINGNDWPYQESIPQACTVEVNGNSNRQIMVETAPATYAVCFSKCAACGENAVRFRVDMSNVDEDLDGIYAEPGDDISPDGVHVLGDFQGIPDPSTLGLQDWNGDNVWETTLSVASASSVSFKFVNGNSFDFPVEEITGACGDAGSRLVQITSDNTVLPVYCWNSCDPCTLPVSITFQVDMNGSCIDTSPGLNLMGTATNWASGTPMSDDNGDGIWELVLGLSPGPYAYKFRVGENGWEGFGGDRTVTVVEETPATLPAVCFGSADPCGAFVAPGDVTFEVTPDVVVPAGQVMWIMSDITIPTWQDGAIPMTDTDADGTWSVTVPQVCFSSIKWKFVMGLDNTNTGANWTEETADFSSIGGCGVDNGTYTDNRQLVRPSADPITVCYNFNTCVSCIVGVEENVVVANLSVYPVPAENILNVNFTSNKAQSIVIKMLNALGQVVIEENAGVISGQRTISLNTSMLASGIYTLAVSNGGGLQTRIVSVK